MFPAFERSLTPEAAAFLREGLSRAKTALPELLPALPRKIGRGPLGGGRQRIEVGRGRPAIVQLDAWRLCDAAACRLFDAAAVVGSAWVDLYLRGDMEERTMVLRARSLLPVDDAAVRLLEEVQRTNMEPHFQAATCDTNLLIRALDHPAFGEAAFNRMVLKAAFLGLPLDRLLEAENGANQELSRMLQGLATEREAAGRAVWPDTCRLIARAPAEGTVARIVGGLEHGDDRLRRAAAEGLALLNRRDLAPFARERLPREPRPEIRALLERCLAP